MIAETAAERLRVALDLADTGIAIMRQNLRRRRPVASDVDIDEELQAWLCHRPGALLGDCPGPSRNLHGG